MDAVTMQQMRTVGATDAATDVTTGATNARRSGMRKLCLGARRAGDSNTKWRRQGVLSGAHNLLDWDAEQHQTNVLRE